MSYLASETSLRASRVRPQPKKPKLITRVSESCPDKNQLFSDPILVPSKANIEKQDKYQTLMHNYKELLSKNTQMERYYESLLKSLSDQLDSAKNNVPKLDKSVQTENEHMDRTLVEIIDKLDGLKTHFSERVN